VHEPSQQFWFVMLACIGSALFLALSDGTKYAKAVIGSAPLLGIGLINTACIYGINQFLSCTDWLLLGNESASGYVLAVVLCIILAALSWRFVEEPFRDRKVVSKKNLLTAFAIFSLLIITWSGK
jgi:peptidoglycan/LPS O-acetylase OafA/YrhL